MTSYSRSRNYNDPLLMSPSIFSNEFHNVFNDLDRLVGQHPGFLTSTQVPTTGPRVTLVEEGKELKAEVEVAGFPRESLSIEFPEPEVLRLSGKYEQERHEEPAAGDGSTAAAAGSGNKKHDTTNTVATTSSHKAVSKNTPARRVWRDEHVLKSFTRSITLPASIDTEAVTASLNHGVLSIVMPKVDKGSGVKRIEITGA